MLQHSCVSKQSSAYAQGILGDALYKEGAFKEAAEHYHDALRAYERHYRTLNGPESVELAGAAQIIAWDKLKSGKFEDATVACETALGLTQRLLGVDSTDAALSMVNLATAYMNTGMFNRSVELLLKDALNIFLKKQDPRENASEAPDIATKIGHVYLVLGNFFLLQDPNYNIFLRVTIPCIDKLTSDSQEMLTRQWNTIRWLKIEPQRCILMSSVPP